jgi:DNA repair protein RadC
MASKIVNQETGAYLTDEEVISMAVAIINHRFGLKRASLNSPSMVRDYLQLTLTGKEHEVFACVFIDAQNRVIAVEELFRGTLTQTSVYPREVVKSALHHNCAAVILAHNHPSGVAEPSHADQCLTNQLKGALAMVDVKVLDHFIIAGGSALSFAERGLL